MSEPAKLGPMLIDAWRLIRTLRAEYRAASELLGIALELLREREVEIARLRERYHRALDGARALRQRRAA